MGLVDQADADYPDVYHFIGAVYGYAQEVLLLSVAIVPDQGEDVSWEFDFQAFRFYASAD